MKKISTIIICLLGIITIGISMPMVVSADSGWDNDYGGGSSHSSGSSGWSSSSSHDYSHSSSSGTRYKKNTEPITFKQFMEAMLFIIAVNVICVILCSILSVIYKWINSITSSWAMYILTILRSRRTNRSKTKEFNNRDIKKQIYDSFVEVQKAWMNFDYNSLKKLCSSELYESYKSDLEVLKNARQQNIMEKFKYKNCHIVDVVESDKKLILFAILRVNFKDYVIMSGNKRIVKGSKHKIFRNVYKLEFIVNKKPLTNCPNCGAELTGNECTYCHTTFENNSTNLVLNNKKLEK